jgi:DNA-binding MarR family transcriptional regulator
MAKKAARAAAKKSKPGKDAGKDATRTRRRKLPVDTQALDGLLGYHIRLAMMELRRSFFRHVGEGGVRPGIASLLQLVAANPGASQVELSQALHVDKASLVALLDKAEGAGWLKRIRSKADRRRHELHLTPSGQSAAEKIGLQMQRFEKKYIDRFTPEEVEMLVDYLRRIYND